MSRARFRFQPPAGRRVAHSHAMLQLLGVKGKLPALGMPATLLPGTNDQGQPVSILVWVAPLVGDAPRGPTGRAQKRSAHRVRCKCPGCGAEVSAGRLFQHVCPVEAPRPDLIELARVALQQEYGTQEHEDAHNAFAEEAGKRMSRAQRREWDSWCLKATDVEIVEEALRILALPMPATA